MSVRSKQRFSISLIMAVFLVAGCEDKIRYEHATVRGKVTYNGKPVTFGQVLFVPVEPPKDGLMQPASGSINTDGTYELKSQADPGAVLGEHKVVVVSVVGDKPADPADAPKDNAAPAPSKTSKAVAFKSSIPKKYSDPGGTPLTRKVVPGANTIDLELAD